MSDYRPTLSSNPYDGAATGVVRNRVLRNTYWLLALSLIPTVLGAAVGMASGVNQIMASSPVMTVVIFLAGAFGLMFAIEKYKESSLGVGLLLLFTFFMGVMLSRLLGFVLGMSNGTQLVMFAFGGTAIVFGTMATLATTIKRDLSGLSKFMFIGVVILLVAGIANIWLKLIFSAFMLIDLQRVVNGGETNYVSATLAIYLDVYNVFSNLLAILGITGGSRD
ncbi:MAG: Bax inhibitor-1 family protein [Burkholderiales bacterium]|nr:Bax inhibitor-1 family protein [Burkholderiales bacterium]